MTTGYTIQRFLSADGSGVGWRLLSGNNRSLARGSVVYPDARACDEALAVLRARHANGVARMRRIPVNRWMWDLELDGLPFATSGRPFDRMIRCEQSLTIFRAQFVHAHMALGVVDSGSRRWQRPGPQRELA